jgi:hypothetical protein
VKARFLLYASQKFMIFKQTKKLIGKFQKKLNKLPPAEDILFVLLFIFSITFGALLFGIGEKIKNEKDFTASKIIPTKLEREIKKMVADHPIENMATYISRRDKSVAAYLIAIAKKESNWGIYSPKKDGKECYNYWGYRGTYNQTNSGYSCFDTPKQAVQVVGGRISELIDQDINTPRKMIVWKCGATCSGHDPASVEKWIQDVDWYYKKF